MDIHAKNITYNSSAISKEQFDAHEKLYTGYVSKVNEIQKNLVTAPRNEASSTAYSIYRGLKKGETFSLNGVILHELYFENMSSSKTQIGLSTKKIINDSFGSYENWFEDFKACGLSARGWCIFAYEQRTKTFKNILLDEHDLGFVAFMYPIIIMDMYEHAYFYDYRTDKAKYISNFTQSIDWNIIEQRASLLLS